MEKHLQDDTKKNTEEQPLQRKKVLIFSLTYHPFIGGAEVAVREITDRIPHGEIEFHMITVAFDQRLPRVEQVGNILVYRIGFAKDDPKPEEMVSFPLKLNKFFYPLLALWKGLLLHRKHKYDATWSIMANYAGFAGLFFKFLHSRVPFLLTLQEGDPLEDIKKKVKRVRFLFDRIFRRADFIQPISYYLAKFARDMGYKGELAVVPNGVDGKHFSHGAPKQMLHYLEENLGKQKHDVFVVTTSRLVPKNGVKDIITALTFLPEQYKLVIVGTGPDRGMLEKLVAEKKLQGRVKFAGQVNHKEIPHYLQISDIFVRPSLSEGFGNSFIEAMAAGIPVIATPVGGIPDFLYDPKINPERFATGIFCKVSDPEDLAGKISMLMEKNELRKELVHNAKKMALEKYDWSLIAAEMKEKVFKPLLKEI